MKEQNWEDSIDAPTDILEVATTPIEEDEIEAQSTASPTKSEFTQMRRRIEERLDSKRISLDFDYESLDNWSDSVQ